MEGGLQFKNLVSSIILGIADEPVPTLDCVTTVYEVDDCQDGEGREKDLLNSVDYLIIG